MRCGTERGTVSQGHERRGETIAKSPTHSARPCLPTLPLEHLPDIAHPQPSQKTFRIKQKLAKKSRQNRPVPQWFRLKTDSECTRMTPSLPVLTSQTAFRSASPSYT
jgi:ribosomal protein L39E